MNELILLSSGSDVFTTFIIIIIGAILAVLQKRYFSIPVSYALFLYFWHTINSIAYSAYSKVNGGDAVVYFTQSQQIDEVFKPGTIAIQYIAAPFSYYLGLSYIGVMVAFGIFGFFGLIFLASALRELALSKAQWVNRVVFVIPFLPGINFWSSAIGKDSMLLFGIGLSCWAAVHMKQRILALLFAVAIVFIARPHIAGVLLISLTIIVIFFENSNVVFKVVFSIMLVPICMSILVFGLQYAGLENLSSSTDLNSYFEQRQGYNLEGGSSVDISDMNFLVRIFTYLFRPFFFDANGVLGLVASFENFFLILITISFLFRAIVRKVSLPTPLMAFLFIFFSITLVLLANTTANLGIALRQKWMIVPMLLMMFVMLQKNVRRTRNI